MASTSSVNESATFSRLCLAIVVLLFLAINARWIWVYRHGLALQIDEAGYLAYSFIDYYGLLYGGIHGWIAAIEMPSIQAPLTMVLSSLLYYVGGPHVILGFVVPLAAGSGSIVATYALGRSLGSDRIGLTAAVLTASCPIIVDYSRSYQFSILATFITTLVLVAILRSRQFRRIGWALVFGVCIGLMPLARTMTFAFIPGLVGAAFVVVMVDPADRLRRVLMLGGALIIGVLVAATWLWPNGSRVAHYLLDFGYGNHALEYGRQTSKLGFDAWLSTAQAFIAEVYFPHFVVTLVGLLALLVVALREAARRGIAATVRRVLRSPVLPVAIFATEAIIVLTTSSNKGSGFFAPIIPALMVLTAWVFWRLRDSRFGRGGVSVLVPAAAIVASLPLVDLHTPFAPGWVVELPVLGAVTVTQGRGIVQLSETHAGYGAQNAAEPLDTATSRAWANFSAWTAATLTEEAGQQAIVAFGFRHALYNVNTVNLEQLLHVHSAFSVRQVDPTMTGESVGGYLDWLRREDADACALLTSDRLGGDFLPAINRSMMEDAARQADFIPVRHWPAPDGQIITMWKHRTLPANCSS